MDRWRACHCIFFKTKKMLLKRIFRQTVFRSRERGEENLWEDCGEFVCRIPLPSPLSLPPFPVPNDHKTAV